jgi:hypothetical protein
LIDCSDADDQCNRGDVNNKPHQRSQIGFDDIIPHSRLPLIEQNIGTSEHRNIGAHFVSSWLGDVSGA